MSLALESASPLNSTTVRAIKAFLNAMARRSSLGIAARIAPRWTLRRVSKWFVTPPRHRQPAAEAAFLATGLHCSLTTTQGSLAVWQFGDRHAPAIITSHGWGGRGGQFRALIPALMEAGFQVWVFDHVGHGQSGGQEATLVDFAAGLRRVHAEVEASGAKVHGYLGHSLGSAAIAVALAGKDGRAPLGDHGKGKRVLLIAPPASLVRYSRIFALHLGLPERIRDAMQWRIEQRLGVRWRDFELPDAARDLRAQALIIHDQQDRDVSIATGLSVARGWPGARFRRTHGLGHHRILRDPAVLRDACDFFTGEVLFSPPPSQDEWDSFPGPAPLW